MSQKKYRAADSKPQPSHAGPTNAEPQQPGTPQDIFGQIKDFAEAEKQPQEPPKPKKPWYKDKKRSWDLLYSSPDYERERKFTKEEAERRIKFSLIDDMPEFDFRVSTAKLEGVSRKKMKRCIRAVHLAFECRNCSPSNRFTSHIGTIVVSFQVKKVEEWAKELKNPYLVTFNVRIYQMACAKCDSMCTAKIFEGHLEAVEIQFANIVSNIIMGVKVLKKKANIRFFPDVEGHRNDLCEACKQGICKSKMGAKPRKRSEADELTTRPEKAKKKNGTKPEVGATKPSKTKPPKPKKQKGTNAAKDQNPPNDKA